MADNKNTVLAAFQSAQEPLKAGQVAELVGIEKDIVSKVIKELQKEGKLESPKRCFYAPVHE